MFIPKSKMHLVIDAVDLLIEQLEEPHPATGQHEVPPAEDLEILAQMRDRASLCQHGDAPFLEVEVCYSENPCANVRFDKVDNDKSK